MEVYNVKKVSLIDLLELQHIGKQTFIETFAAENTEENMKKYVEDGFSTEKLTTELLNSDSEFYFATVNNEVVGYLKINSGNTQTEIKDSNSIEIERIYVLKAYHGKKVGQLLYDYALKIAIEKNVNYVWLGVWERNMRAINFYKKNGFEEFDKHIFLLGEDAQTDIMMKLEIK